MESFQQIWESSRTNAWSWGYPTVLWTGVGLLIVLSLVRTEWMRLGAKTVVIVALAVVATKFFWWEIQEKWRIRGEWAQAHSALMTPADREALTCDGANLTLGPLIFGFQAFMLFVAAAAALSVVRIAVSRFRRKRPACTRPTDAETTTTLEKSSNALPPPPDLN
jgi:hypothetical protein